MVTFVHRMLRGAIAVTVAAATILVLPQAAHADRVPSPAPTKPCASANLGEKVQEVNAVEVNPTLTQFLSINIAPGTTGERTETLQVVNTVETTYNNSTEITGDISALFFKVSVKVGYSVQERYATTRTETTSMRWTFSQPGYYALYKGTRAVRGTFATFLCIGPPIVPRYFWLSTNTITPFTTFANLEVGTVRCDEVVPGGSLRERAKQQLGC